MFRVKQAEIHPTASISDEAKIVAEELHVAEGVRIDAGVELVGTVIRLEADSRICAGADITAVDTLILGRNSILGPGLIAKGRRLEFGEHFWSKSRVTIGGGGSAGPRATLKVGRCCNVVEDTLINLSEPVTIGDGFGMSCGGMILTHGAAQPVLEGFPSDFRGVTIEDDVVMFVRAMVMPGVTLRRGTMVAAGALVNKSTHAYSLVGGVPARVIKLDVRTPLDADQRRNRLADILARYAETLKWKGVIVTTMPAPSGPELQSFDSIDEVGRSAEMALEFAGERAVFRVISGPPLGVEIDQKGPNGGAFFNVDAMTVVGNLGGIAEDLRDFMRRSGVRLFTHHPFRSIPPAGLARLREFAMGAGDE